MPKEDYLNKTKYLSAGSDAHHPEEIGTYLEIESTPSNLFKDLTSNTSHKISIKEHSKSDLYLFMKSTLTTLNEYLIKKKLRISMKKS